VAWSGLIRPPQLQHSETDAGTQRAATWLELFFDLAFLLVVAELAVGLLNDLTPPRRPGVRWTVHQRVVAWAGFTFYANRFDTDDLAYRLAKLAADAGRGRAGGQRRRGHLDPGRPSSQCATLSCACAGGCTSSDAGA
jgi:hypothetical protein